MTTSVTMDYSNESLDSSGYEDTERLKVSINRNNNYDVMMINFLTVSLPCPFSLNCLDFSPSLPLLPSPPLSLSLLSPLSPFLPPSISRRSSDLLRDMYMS